MALAFVAILVDLAQRRAEPFLRARVVQELEDHFHARVELDSFHISLVKGLWAEGKGLRIWPPAQAGGIAVPPGGGQPLIRLDEFRFHAPLHYSPGKPIHITVVELRGLKVDLPPRSHLENPTLTGSPEAAARPRGEMERMVSFEVDTIKCTAAELVMETSKADKLPLDFRIAHLKLTGISSGSMIGFDAELTNPRPEGTIHTAGKLGASHPTDLGASPIEGTYRFEHADLAGFKGIAGILSSTGRYQGTLRDLTVDGQTNTPDFRLTHFGNAMPLTTRFHAQVDGTNGDTWLEPVDATLGHSHFTAQGEIVRVMIADADGRSQSIGHDIDLKVNVEKGRIEDFLHLASNSDSRHSSKALLEGIVTVRTKLHIPPGPEPIHERLMLDGWFSLDRALFSSEKIQERIAELSLRGQGRPGDVKTADPASILSHMQSDFRMEKGLLTLPALEYTVPGAKIQLKGTYTVEGGALDFDGSAKLEAPVSKIVGGWKGFLLTPADRYFKKDGAGTEVPIHIDGTREAPEFGVEFKKMKLEDKQ